MFFIEQMVQDKRLYEEFSIMKAQITVFNLKILFFNSKAKCTLGSDGRFKKLTSLNGPEQQAKESVPSAVYQNLREKKLQDISELPISESSAFSFRKTPARWTAQNLVLVLASINKFPD